MVGSHRTEGLNWVATSKDSQEMKERYSEWAVGYEETVVQAGCLGPKRAADIVASRVSTDSRILDAGAGTGAVGVELEKLGFTHITGIDLSPGMLEVAKSKGVYEALQEEELGTALNLPTDGFDATACVATLTIAHAPPDSLDELLRVTVPGGVIVFTMRPEAYENNGFKEKQASLEDQGKWKLVERSEPFRPLPDTEPDMTYVMWAYEVLP